MMLYSFKLDEESKTLYIIITLFGKYQYNRLPMRIKVAPDIAQEKIEETPCGINCELFINDIRIFFEQLGEHMATLTTVLQRLKIERCWFCNQSPEKRIGRQGDDFLSYWLTPVGLKPWHKTVDWSLRCNHL